MRIVLAGGAQLYAQTMPLARQLDIAYVHRAVDGDAYFPAIYRSIWHETAREEHAASAALRLSPTGAPRRDGAMLRDSDGGHDVHDGAPAHGCRAS